MRLKDCINVDDLRLAAKRRAHKMVFDYIDGGADDEKTLRTNSSAFDDYDLAFRVLRGVDDVDTSTTLLGEEIDVPFFCSPSAGNRLFHTEGEIAVARAAADVGTIYSLSTLSSITMEEVAVATASPKWFQLYVWKDRGLVREMLARAREADYRALILTVDFAVTGNRERDLRNGFTIPPSYGLRQAWEAIKSPRWSIDYVFGKSIKYANLSADTAAVSLNEFVADQLHAGLSWHDAEWLLGEWSGNAVIKGVVRPDDARQAVDIGFNAIAISNHGGRQLDRSAVPIRVLPSIADRIGSDAELIVDGGVRRGTDIIKAIALGASAVSFARPYLYGLAAGGYRGVAMALRFFAESLRRDMALVGAASIAELTPDLVLQPGSGRSV